jgi:hypothetical protein
VIGLGVEVERQHLLKSRIIPAMAKPDWLQNGNKSYCKQYANCTLGTTIDLPSKAVYHHEVSEGSSKLTIYPPFPLNINCSRMSRSSVTKSEDVPHTHFSHTHKTKQCFIVGDSQKFAIDAKDCVSLRLRNGNRRSIPQKVGREIITERLSSAWRSSGDIKA